MEIINRYYESILKLFIGNDKTRPFMRKPFKIGKKVYATNGHQMIIFSATKAKSVEGLEGKKYSYILDVIPTERNNNLSISVAELMTAFLLANGDKRVECEACAGTTSVEYTFKYDGDTFEKEHECPICDGKGFDNNNESIFFIIKNCRFTGVSAKKLLSVAEKLEADEIVLTYQGMRNHASLFQIKDVEVLVMPCDPTMEYKDAQIFYTKK